MFYRAIIIDSIWLCYDRICAGAVNIQSLIRLWNVEKIFNKVVDAFDKIKNIIKDFVFNFLEMCRAMGLYVIQVFRENYAYNV